MLVGDYCGDGYPFTVAGQHLIWQGGGMSYYGKPAALEARWDANGATCLDTPRMEKPSTNEGWKQFPDIEAAIANHCATRPPRCADSNPSTMAGALRVSALPF